MALDTAYILLIKCKPYLRVSRVMKFYLLALFKSIESQLIQLKNYFDCFVSLEHQGADHRQHPFLGFPFPT